MSVLLSALKGKAFSCKVTLVLAVFSIFLLTTPALAWKTFYLDPKDPHFIKIEDPAGKLKDVLSCWYSNCLAGDPRPKIYFKILEFDDKGGLIKFYYRRSGQSQLHLYASKDGIKYVELWKNLIKDSIEDEAEVTVEVPPGYKYFYFYFRDGDERWETITLWKKIKFMVLETPTSTPTPTPPAPSPSPRPSHPPHAPTLPLPRLPSLPSLPAILQPPSMFTLIIVCFVVVTVLVIVCVVAVVVLIITKLRKTRSKKV